MTDYSFAPDPRKTFEQQRSGGRSVNALRNIRRDYARKAAHCRKMEKTSANQHYLVQLAPHVGLRVRQLGTNAEFVIERIVPGIRKAPPRVYVAGLTYPINPLTLERV
jgi:hypothetical protein